MDILTIIFCMPIDRKMLKEAIVEFIGECERQGIIVQWLVFNQFAVSSGMSLGMSIVVFFGLSIARRTKDQIDQNDQKDQTLQNAKKQEEVRKPTGEHKDGILGWIISLGTR